MRIKKIYIKNYKNLIDFKVNFEDDQNLIVFIGENGSGKSNLFQALTIIFSNIIDENYEFQFDFSLDYYFYNDKISIIYSNNTLIVKLNDKERNKNILKNKIPNNIFFYYSGFENRIEKLFKGKYFMKYKKNILSESEIRLRKLFYIENYFYKLAFVSNAVYNNRVYNKSLNLIKSESIELMELVMKQPNWSKKNDKDLFYSAKGSTRILLNEIENLEKNNKNIIINKNEKGNCSNIIIKDINLLKNDIIREKELFARLETLYLFDLLEDVKIKLKKGINIIDIDELSEGEKQIILILNLLAINDESEVVFFLDEPDSFLHPRWQRELLSIIKEEKFSGQIFVTTHSPLTLGEINKEEIYFINSGKIMSPSIESKNKNVSDILVDIMNVSARPEKIEKIINNFYDFIENNNISGAEKIFEEIKNIIDEDDSFLIQAEAMLKRMKILYEKNN